MAPLEIGAGAFPNAKIGFQTWILDIAANMAVFPVVGIFLVLLNIIIDAVSGSNVGSSGHLIQSAVWAPSLLSASGISPSIIGAAIGLAGLALISKLPDMVPQYIFMIKPSPWGQAIGEGLNPSKMPIVGGAISGSERSAQERFGKYVVGTGKDDSGALVNQAATKIQETKVYQNVTQGVKKIFTKKNKGSAGN